MFNALRYTKDLETAGFSRQQAEAAIDVFYKFMEYNFATKEDVKGIQSDISMLRQDILHNVQSMEYKMTIKFGIMQSAGIAFLAALIKFL